MQCSVCGAEAEDLSSGDFDGLIVRCKHCGEYEIADVAVNGFLRLGYDQRVAVLGGARSAAAAGQRPAITEAAVAANST